LTRQNVCYAITAVNPVVKSGAEKTRQEAAANVADYLIDTEHGVIVDVEATRALRQAEVGAARTMLERTETRFGIKPHS
jgi:hypothetical protein